MKVTPDAQASAMASMEDKVNGIVDLAPEPVQGYIRNRLGKTLPMRAMRTVLESASDSVDTLKEEWAKGEDLGVNIIDTGTRAEHENRVRGWVGDDTYDNMPGVAKEFLHAAATESVTGDYWKRRLVDHTSTIQEDLIVDTTLGAIISGGVGVVAAPAKGVAVGAAAKVKSAIHSGYLFMTRGVAGATVDAPANLYSEVLFREDKPIAALVTGVGISVAGAITVERAMSKTLDGTLARISPDFWQQQAKAPDVISMTGGNSKLTELARLADEGDERALGELTAIIARTRKLKDTVTPFIPELDAASIKAAVDELPPRVAVPTNLNRTAMWKAAEKATVEPGAESIAKVDEVTTALAHVDVAKSFDKAKKKLTKEMVELDIKSHPAHAMASYIEKAGGINATGLKNVDVPYAETAELRKLFPKMFSKGVDINYSALINTSKEFGYGTDMRKMFDYMRMTPNKKQFTEYTEAMLSKEFDEMYQGMFDVRKFELEQKLMGAQVDLADLTKSSKYKRIPTKDEIVALRGAVKVAKSVRSISKKQAFDSMTMAEKQASNNAAAKMAEYKAAIKARREQAKIEIRLNKAILSPSVDPAWQEQLAVAMQTWAGKSAKQVIEGIPDKNMGQFLATQVKDSPLGDAVSTFMNSDEYIKFLSLPKRKSVDQLTLDDWGVIDRFQKSFNMLGRNEKQLSSALEKANLSQVVAEINHNLAVNPNILSEVGSKAAEDRNILERLSYPLLKVMPSLKRMRFIARDFDNFADNGIFKRIVVDRATEAERHWLELGNKYMPRVQKVFDSIGAEDLQKHFASKVTFKAGGHTLDWTRERLFMAGLNSGNSWNKAALLNTIENELKDSGIVAEVSENVIGDITSLLTKGEQKAIKEFWSITKELGPQLSDVHKTLTGKTMKIEGNMFPIAAEADRLAVGSEKTAENILEKNNYSSAWKSPQGRNMRTMRKGGTKRLRLDVDVIGRHIQDSILQVSHAVHLSDFNKLINDRSFKAAVVDTRGKAWLEQLYHWRDAVGRTAEGQSNGILRVARHNVTVAMLGITNIGVITKQPLSAIAAVREIGGGSAVKGQLHLAKAARDFLIDPSAIVKSINDVEPLMAARGGTMNREMLEMIGRFSPKDSKFIRKYHNLQNLAMSGIQMGDKVGAHNTWLATFNRVMEETGDYTKAKEMAIDVVNRTQPVSTATEMPHVMAGLNEWNKAFTMFMGYFNILHGMTSEITRRLPSAIHGATESYQLSRSDVMSSLFFMFFAPAVTGYAVTKGKLPDKEEWFGVKPAASLATATVPYFRDVSSSLFSGYDYSPTPLSNIGKELVSSMKEAGKGDDLDPKRLGKINAKLSGYVLGLPVKSTMDRTAGFLEMLEGDASFHDAVFGKAKEDR